MLAGLASEQFDHLIRGTLLLNEAGGYVAVRTPDPGRLHEMFAALGFVTCSPRMTPVLQYSYKAARVSDASILLQGETSARA